MRISSQPRRGVTMIWAVLVLSIVATIITVLTQQLLLDRRAADQRRNRAQCQWLARSGVEMAADRLLRDPKGYTAETIEPIAHAEVRISVVPEKGDVFVVTSTARFPTDDAPSVQTATRRFKRTLEKGTARLEAVP